MGLFSCIMINCLFEDLKSQILLQNYVNLSRGPELMISQDKSFSNIVICWVFFPLIDISNTNLQNNEDCFCIVNFLCQLSKINLR